RERGQRGPIFTVGFCFGGGHSWRLAASDLDLAGVIGFYGLPRTVRDVLGELSKPMLLLVAGDDAATPIEEANTFADELAAAGADVERYVYDGAPHSFFDASFDEWRDACADAWRRILDFTARHAVTS
ncbi:MAG: dienelactone hydrolase family protein, partial [Sciscionella sp.]|nr:dienelactone hydrolase family protein [Sciscionella sp.]